MPLDSGFIYALQNELSEVLTDGKIDKIQMPEKDCVIFSIRAQFTNVKLLVSTNNRTSRIHLTEQSFENPQQPPMFCMLLRKYLIGARIQKIYQPDFERLLIIDLVGSDELNYLSQKHLIVELMGKNSNLILANEDWNIIDCIYRRDYGGDAQRRLLPGMIYRMPPKQDKQSIYLCDNDERRIIWENSNEDDEPEKRIINSFSGVSPVLCKELAHRCYGDISNMPLVLNSFVDYVLNRDYQPFLYFEDSRPKDFGIIGLSGKDSSIKNEVMNSFSQLLDSYYSGKDKEEFLKRKGKNLYQTVKTVRNRTERKLEARIDELEKTKTKDEKRLKADLIIGNIYRIKKGDKILECENYYEETCPHISISLDPLKTPQQNAEKLYKEYNKLKTAEEYLTGLVKENSTQLEYLNSVLNEINMAESVKDLDEIYLELMETGYIRKSRNDKKLKIKIQPPYEFLTDDGYTIFVGRNNAMNDKLTHHDARRTDYWFHAQKIHGSHVILKCDGLEPSENAMELAACLAAYYSQSRESGKVVVDYTMVRNLKKPSGALPGFVIYHEYNSMVVSNYSSVIEENIRLKRIL